MKRIVTVQNLIDELMLVHDKEAEIHIVQTDGAYETEYTPGLYDFAIKDYTDKEPPDFAEDEDEDDNEHKVVLEMYR